MVVLLIKELEIWLLQILAITCIQGENPNSGLYPQFIVD